jgi:error-prone DNA polymerase
VAVRLGLAGIRHVGTGVAEQIVADRALNGPYRDIGDLTDRVPLARPVAEALATAGTFSAFGPDRRQALWTAGAAARARTGHLPGLATGIDAPALPGMSAVELATADLWATGVTPGVHPIQFLRAHLDHLGAVPAGRLLEVVDGTRVLVGGAVTHKQRPATAGGITFLNLEDETGMANVIVSVGLWHRARAVLNNHAALVVRGIAQVGEGAVSVVADQITPLDLRGLAAPSRDFR